MNHLSSWMKSDENIEIMDQTKSSAEGRLRILHRKKMGKMDIIQNHRETKYRKRGHSVWKGACDLRRDSVLSNGPASFWKPFSVLCQPMLVLWSRAQWSAFWKEHRLDFGFSHYLCRVAPIIPVFFVMWYDLFPSRLDLCIILATSLC